MPLRQFWVDFDVHSVTAKQTSLSSECSFLSALTQPPPLTHQSGYMRLCKKNYLYTYPLAAQYN